MTGKRKKMNKGGMNEEGDAYASRRGELQGERKWRIWLQRERDGKADENRG